MMHERQQQASRDFASRFDKLCQTRIAPRARLEGPSGVLPAENLPDLVAAGYLGLFHPKEIGGSGADGWTLAAAMESLARACASTFWAVSISTVLCGKMLYELCTPKHHEEWLAPIIKGQKIGCFAATEDGAGSDPQSYKVTLRRTERGYRLSGEKSRISNACTADVAVVLARREDAGSAGLGYVIVDLRKPGIRRSELAKLGLDGMSWGTIGFRDVEIAPEDVIEGASIEKTLQSVEWGQLLQTFCAIGLAQASLDTCHAYAAERQAFGRPIAHLPVVYGRLADMHAEIQAARLFGTEVAVLKADGRPARESVMMAKIHSTEMAVRVADGAMRTLGGWGYARRHIIERLYRDSLANVPAGLPTDRLRELLACSMVGVDPWIYEPFEVSALQDLL